MSIASKKGNKALGQAIAHFSRLGWTISIPLNDTQEYDLIIDIEGELKKVQCKYTSTKERSGNYRIDIRTKGHKNASGKYYCKKMNHENIDYIYSLTEDDDAYFIPIEIFKGKQQLTLNHNHENYKL